MSRPKPHHRDHYRHFLEISTRWQDNDVYGHVNNAVYYAYFDTVVNRYLIDSAVLDPGLSPVIGLVVETSCRYFAPISFPDTVMAGLAVVRIGSSSVRYEIGLFRNHDDQAAAQGEFVHVYVDRASRRPAALREPMREVLQAILI